MSASACAEWTRANRDRITDRPAARLRLWTMLRAGFVRNLAVVVLVRHVLRTLPGSRAAKDVTDD